MCKKSGFYLLLPHLLDVHSQILQFLISLNESLQKRYQYWNEFKKINSHPIKSEQLIKFFYPWLSLWISLTYYLYFNMAAKDYTMEINNTNSIVFKSRGYCLYYETSNGPWIQKCKKTRSSYFNNRTLFIPITYSYNIPSAKIAIFTLALSSIIEAQKI